MKNSPDLTGRQKHLCLIMKKRLKKKTRPLIGFIKENQHVDVPLKRGRHTSYTLRTGRSWGVVSLD